MISSSVKSVAEFIQVLLKMFFTQTMIGTHDKSSEVTDKRVDVREYRMRSVVFDDTRVMHKSMFLKGWIDGQTVSANRASRCNNCFGELHDGSRIDLFHSFHPRKSNVLLAPFAFEKRYRNEHRGLVGTPSPFSALCRGSNEQFVNFHRFGKLIPRVPFRHSVTDSLEHGPRRSVIHANLLRKQPCGIAALVRGDEEDCKKPALQRSAGFVENRSSRERIEMETGATLIHSSGGDSGIKIGFATLVARHAFWPTYPSEVVLARCFRRKGGEEVYKVEWLIGVGHNPTLPYQKVFSALTA